MPAGPAAVLKSWPPPQELSLSLPGPPAEGVRRGRPVSAGQLLARAPRRAGLAAALPNRPADSQADGPVNDQAPWPTDGPADGPNGRPAFEGDLHAPYGGLVVRLEAGRLLLRLDESLSGRAARPLDLEALSGPTLAEALQSLGADIPASPAAGEPALVSALVPEPGLELVETLRLDQAPAVRAGAALLRRLWPDAEFWEILPPLAEPLGLGRPVRPALSWPLTLRGFLKLAVLGRHDPTARGTVALRELWTLGTAARSGLPCLGRPAALQKSAYLVPPGLKIADVLAALNLRPLAGDAVVLGGLRSGRSVWRLDRGLDRRDEAVHLLRGAWPAPAPAPCRRCRRCRQACPLGLPVDVLAGEPLTQWRRLAATAGRLLAGCLRCAACAAACPSARPLAALTWSLAPESAAGETAVAEPAFEVRQAAGPGRRP